MVAAMVLIAALYFGRAIAIPIAIAVLIAFSLGPLVTWLHRHRVSRALSVTLVVVPALLTLGAFAYLVTTEIGRLADNIPVYQSNIERKLETLEKSLPARQMLERGSEFLRNSTPTPSQTESKPASPENRGQAPGSRGSDRPVPVEVVNPEPTPLEVARSVLGPMVDPLFGIGLVLLFVIFFLVAREDLRDRLIRLAGAKDLHRTTMAMDEAGYRVSRFLLLQTIVNSTFGSVVGVGLYIIGLPNAALWGAIAAILRFIPYLGVAAASILPLALSFAVDPGWAMLLWTAVLFLGLELLVGNIVEPVLYGSSTGLSAIAFVISAIFWTWLWGPIGLLLATPLTVCLTVLGRYVPRFGFLEILLGNEAPLKPEESFYQRLLAGDPDEASELAEEFLKVRDVAAFYDELAVPALRLAENDRLRGALDDDHLQQIVAGLKLITENLSSDRDETKQSEANGIVLCAAGRSDLDEAAAMLLAQRLSLSGHRTICLSHEDSVRMILPNLDRRELSAACLSFLDHAAVPHARYLVRRFRRRLNPDIQIMVGFWGASPISDHLDDALAEIRADRIVVSFEAAIAALTVEPPPRATLEDPPLQHSLAKLV